MKEIRIILKNGEKIEFMSKKNLPCKDKKLALYLTDDNALYTIRIDEIAVAYEKTIET
jgi:hypothetical protein